MKTFQVALIKQGSQRRAWFRDHRSELDVLPDLAREAAEQTLPDVEVGDTVIVCDTARLSFWSARVESVAPATVKVTLA